MKQRISLAVLAVALLASSAAALRFWNRAEEYRDKLAAAESALAAPPPPVPELPPLPAPSAASLLEQPAGLPAATNEDSKEEEIRRLTLALQARDEQVATLLRRATNAPPEQSRPWRDRSAWEEEMKKSDPERYAEMMKQREEARQRVQRSFAEKAAFFINRDASSLSEEEQEARLEMLGLLDETWRLTDQLRSDMPREERREIIRAVRENMTVLQPMLDAERDREFYALGRQLGYTEADSAAFMQYLNGVVEATSLRSVYQGMRPGPPPRPEEPAR